MLIEFIGYMLSVKGLVNRVERLLKGSQMPLIDKESLEDKIESLSERGRKALKQAVDDNAVQRVFSILGFRVTSTGVRGV